MFWRKSKSEAAATAAQSATNHSSSKNNSTGNLAELKEAALRMERKSLISIYILCRVLMEVVKQSPPDVLGDDLSEKLEEIVFKQLRTGDPRTLSMSVIRRENWNLFAELLGEMSNSRFLSVGDRFIAELEKVPSVISKEQEPHILLLINGMKYLKLKIYPMDALEESAEFIESLGKFFSRSNSTPVKIAYSEALSQILLPLAGVATAELNHPMWVKPVETIFAKAMEMIAKPKYWAVAFQLATVILSVAPQELFARHWLTLFESHASKIKDKANRAVIYIGVSRLLWVFVFRWSETLNSTTKKLDIVSKVLFNPGNKKLWTSWESGITTAACVYLIRIGSHGYLQYVLDNILLQMVHSGSVDTLTLESIIPERATVGVRSFMYILSDHETTGTSASRPPFPDDVVLQSVMSNKDRSEPKHIPLPTGSLLQFYEKCCKCIVKLAVLCDTQFGAHITSVDDRPIQLKPMSVSFHFGNNDSYAQHQRLAYLELFSAVIDFIPWCHFPDTQTLTRTTEILCRNVVHSNPKVAQASISALKCLVETRDTRAIVNIYTKLMFSFDEKIFTSYDCPPSSASEFEKILQVYVSLLEIWIANIRVLTKRDANQSETSGSLSVSQPSDDDSSRRSDDMILNNWWSAVEEIEGNGLFFLCSQDRAIRLLAVKIIRLTTEFDEAIRDHGQHMTKSHSRTPSKSTLTPPCRVIQLMETVDLTELFEASKPNIELSMPERSRLAKLHGKKKETLVALAESDYGVDTALWLKAFPTFIKKCFENYPIPIAICRNIVCVRLVRMYDVVVEFSRSEAVAGTANYAFILKHPMRTHPEVVVEQWRTYLIVACSTLTLTDEQKLHIPDSRYQHGRKKSAQKITIHHQRITSVRSVFRMVIPLLGVDHPVIRDAIITGIGCINVNIYKALIECLQPAIETWAEESQRLNQSQSNQSNVSSKQTVGIRKDSSAAISLAYRQERVITEIVHLLYITSHYLELPSVAEDEWIISEFVGFLNTLRNFLSLPRVQVDYNFQKLRRYFCGLLENVFLGVSRNTERSNPISFESRMRYFTLIEDWCTVGQHWNVAREREAKMKRAALSTVKDSREHNIILASMELEKKKSDIAILSVLAALCAGPLMQPLDAAGRRKSNVSFNISGLLKWIGTMFESPNDEMHSLGKRALKNLLIHNPDHPIIFEETVANGYRIHSEPKASKSYFVALAEILLEIPDYPCEVRQALALGLFKTGDEDDEVRSLAVDLLKATEIRFYGTSCLQEYRVNITNSTPVVYKRAMFNLSSRFAKDHPQETYLVFSELTKFFHVVNDISRRDILAVLLPWIQAVELQVEVNDMPTPSTAMVMNNLFEITVTFSNRIQNEVEALWVALGNGKYPNNVNAIMNFVLHHSLERRDPVFVEYSRKILAYLAAPPAGTTLIDALMKYLQPKAMIPQHLEPYDLSIAERMYPYVATISAVLPVGNKETTFSHGQLALILLVDLIVSPLESVKANLPLILHVSLVLFDHYLPIINDRSRELLVHVVNEFAGSQAGAQEFCELIRVSNSKFNWSYDNLNSDKNGARTPKMMVQMIKDILGIFGTQIPDLRENWSRVALMWATTCPVRHIACRSFQVFRCLLFTLDQNMLADMLARLSNTISDSTTDIQGFAMQILMTLNAVTAELASEDLINYPQLFWATVACLGTVHEQEFIEVLSILEKFISKIDLDSAETVACLIATFPPKWEAKFRGLQHAVIPGLRSSLAWEQSLRILDRLNQLQDSEIIAGPDRLALAISINLPRYLHALEIGETTPEIEASSDRLRQMCDERGLGALSRILVSFGKGRFRSKQDFLNQTIQALQNNFFPSCEGSVLIFLLGILSNKIKWVKTETMDILKKILPMVDLQKEEFAGVGADIISPLLRLLQTDYAEQALGVLDETISISASNMDKHVLRMSLGNRTIRKEYEKTATMFGIPDESGWAIPMPAVTANITRNNVHAVFYTCNTTPSTEQIPVSAEEFQFHKEEYGFMGGPLDRTDSVSVAEDVEGGSLSHMWTALDNLDSFFTRDMKKSRQQRPNHEHNISVTDTDMSTDNNLDPVESVPQLYDKKVSLILNRSLARTPSTTSFKTSLADSFGNSPTTPTADARFGSSTNVSVIGNSGGPPTPRKREIVDFGRHTRSSSLSSGSVLSSPDIDDQNMSPQDLESTGDEFKLHNGGSTVSFTKYVTSPNSGSSKKLSGVVPRLARTKSSSSSNPSSPVQRVQSPIMRDQAEMPSAPQENSFRLESFLRGANIRKVKKKASKLDKVKEKDIRDDNAKEEQRQEEEPRSKSKSRNGRSSVMTFGTKLSNSPASMSASSSVSSLTRHKDNQTGQSSYQFPPPR
ncbi:Tao3p [Sugiyamaella lignohabitans]|uniref:Tao3p n=1 Tax=Sugiyamaella lignohabitans TaxID=796027 RepID=A0A167ES48_9ASCO|nr:Tao3p [Sugiyamaella lignohabitans]ANB14404.1 Tao3p [Sugiyamaella lignohabitans]